MLSRHGHVHSTALNLVCFPLAEPFRSQCDSTSVAGQQKGRSALCLHASLLPSLRPCPFLPLHTRGFGLLQTGTIPV